MSTRAIHWVQRQSVASRTLKAVLLALAGRASTAGVVVVSQDNLARDLAISSRQVRSHLATLASLGMISREIRSRGARGRAADAITLALSETFDISKIDIGHASGGSIRNRKKSAACGVSQAEVTPPVAQPEENFRANRELISNGSAKPKSCKSNQGASAKRGRAKQADAHASVGQVGQTSKPIPLGKDNPRRLLGSHYATHRTLLDRVTRGTMH